ncbi:MAG: multiheme c-type cytochrome [SAR324 cluster bacterium]|nr:multiheme c-type cytochrome [SAR324 cluster bacterium]
MAVAEASAKRDGARTPWRLVITLTLVVAGAVVSLVLVAAGAESGNVNAKADQWQISYWKKPIPAQGRAPENYLKQARGLLPENCGACHAAQYEDWKQSIHSKAMGPGVAGQFLTMEFSGQAACLKCHAPMTEQWGGLRSDDGQWRANSAFNAQLQSRGMVCSACHLRGHKRHGPPLPPGKTPVSQAVHGEPFRTEFFRASEFCKGCHQHPASSMIINGKTVENTYREWLDTPYPGQGTSCQSCHMPGGRHLWKGIHDPGMTRAGVSISTSLSNEQPKVGEEIEARLTLTNTGTGHAFPTYPTPAVYLKAAFLDKVGAVVPGNFHKEKIIQRSLDMSVYPWGEKFDTRVLPGESVSLNFRRRVPAAAASLYLWVWVEPDNFYTGFYRSFLKRGKDFPGAEQLSQALQNSLDSQYLLFSRTVPIEQPVGRGYH